MINYIKGTVAYVDENYIVLDNNGIGYKITMPSSSLYELTEGLETKIFTHMAVKEDDVSLYGFLNNGDLKMFTQLISVNGIGPKAAIGILSSISSEELVLAIAAGDYKLISTSKGVGTKTAQKIVVELKDKLEKAEVPIKTSYSKSTNDAETAISFVVSTGVSRSECMKALGKAENINDLDVDGIIDIIFKNLSV